MIWTLRNIEDGDVSVEHTIYSLNPGDSGYDLRDFILSKFALLTADQQTAIVAFLSFFADDDDLGRDATAALGNHWRSAR